MAKLQDDPKVQALIEKTQVSTVKATSTAINKVVKQVFTDALLTAKGDKAATASVKVLQNAVNSAIKSAIEGR